MKPGHEMQPAAKNAFEKVGVDVWPDISRQLLSYTESGDIHAAAEILIRYHQGLLATALDTEPSAQFKAAVIRNHGYLESGSLKIGKEQKSALIRPEQQAALALSTALEQIATLIGKPDLAAYYQGTIVTLTELLNNKTSSLYHTAGSRNITEQISATGQILVDAIKNQLAKREAP
jgi:hypothetical protein